jgi:predicted Zn finger-like uncharacterized protein
MRLICPACQQSFTLADAEAGKLVRCTHCQHEFSAPLLPPNEITPIVNRIESLLPVPPPLASETVVTPSAPVAPTTPLVSDLLPVPPRLGAPSFCVELRPALLEWAVPAFLLVALLLTVFNWVGAYPGGYGIYTQNAWQALIGSFSADVVGEKQWQLAAKLNPKTFPAWWLLFYLLAVILGVVVSIAMIVVPRLGIPLPPALVPYWPLRTPILGGLCVLALIVLLLQAGLGLGLDNGLAAYVTEQHAETLAKAITPEEKQLARMDLAKQLGGFQVGYTVWFYVSGLLLTFAVIGVAGQQWLAQRGPQMLPRLELYW